MKSTIRLSASALLAATSALAQFVPAPTNLTTKLGAANVTVRYKQVPTGICELNPNVKSFSGYADVSENEHIFWWFFEARSSPKDAPLTVWINGGPGSSSMIGLFQELGPCGVGPDLKPFDNPYSWSNVSNMLFIDQPTMVGFSYSIPIPGYTDSGYIIQLPDENCPEYAQTYGTCGTYSKPDMALTANTTEGAADNMWKTIQGFVGAFPEYAQNGFNFATESYGGHYGPVFNAYILDQNAKNISGAAHIDLQSVLIGNGWYDPLVQYEAFYNYTVNPGSTYGLAPPNDTIRAEWFNNMYGPGNCYDQTVQCYETGRNDVCSRADNFCYEKVEYPFDLYTERDEYDSRYKTPDPFPYTYYVEYLNRPEILAAIGGYQNFSESAPTVGSAFGSTGDDDRESGTIAANKKLLEAGVQVMHYYGDADYVCNWIGGEVVAAKVDAAGFDKAGYVNISTSDGVVHGEVKQSGLFSFLRIYESGHEVPFYQPLASLEIFARALNFTDIATGLIDISSTHLYKTLGSAKSTYREGNATVQFEVTPSNATYNTKLNAPDPTPTWSAKKTVDGKRNVGKRMGIARERMGKPRRAS
ncbi:alpha/beta-hydrolase [Massarina eburnea CBS 473.64]|uniref:Alpha/beta-hydrolase n=1 Tax=Massarina eburnea CBS 473.64 TaxID=1395130 RepID=A0A6A6S8U3_9PLEO|nr:alpha/beta-hydrolase [Massarina eburnea CBS 473.64]